MKEAEGVVTILTKRANLPVGSLVTAAMNKTGPEWKCGIVLGALNGKVVIKSIKFEK